MDSVFNDLSTVRVQNRNWRGSLIPTVFDDLSGDRIPSFLSVTNTNFSSLATNLDKIQSGTEGVFSFIDHQPLDSAALHPGYVAVFIVQKIDGAEKRTRTSTGLPPQVPETCVSTNSTISAILSLRPKLY